MLYILLLIIKYKKLECHYYYDNNFDLHDYHDFKWQSVISAKKYYKIAN